jgi:hypothetical protein
MIYPSSAASSYEQTFQSQLQTQTVTIKLHDWCCPTFRASCCWLSHKNWISKDNILIQRKNWQERSQHYTKELNKVRNTNLTNITLQINEEELPFFASLKELKHWTTLNQNWGGSEIRKRAVATFDCKLWQPSFWVETRSKIPSPFFRIPTKVLKHHFILVIKN